MGYPRKSLICLADTPYYHVVARCVRRAWLCGYDAYAGKNYSHRKGWILQRLRHMSGVFSIDLCAYAIMSNHYHLVLRVDRERGTKLSRQEIVERWTSLFGQPPLINRWQDGTATTAERAAAEQLIERWRSRLIDISWYMRSLNEHLARRANAEDKCTGRFWEGRFKSQALLDESGLVTAMVYVDLNPVRARIAATPEESKFTSIHARICQQAVALDARSSIRQANSIARITAPALLAFRNEGNEPQFTLPIQFADYLQLVDWTARMTRRGQRGAIAVGLPPILMRLQIDPTAWSAFMQPGGNTFGRALGRLEQLRSHAHGLGQSWVQGLHSAHRLFGRA